MNFADLRPLRMALPVVALLVVGLPLSSCVLTRGGDDQVILRLDPPHVPAGANRWQGDVKLAPARAQGVVAQLRYAYALGDGGALQQARTLSWDRPPPQYLEQALATALHGAGMRVLKPGETGASVIRISPTLLHFEERSGPATHAAVAFDLEIRRGDETALVKRYCSSAPIRTADASARAGAFGVALGRAVQDFLQDTPGATGPGTDCATSLPSSSR